jgi:hypothetical protein
MKWLRKLFGLQYPHLSRKQIAEQTAALLSLNADLVADLKHACAQGRWRFDHPLSKACPEHMKSRHPKLTEAEIEAEYRRIMAGPNELFRLAQKQVVQIDAPVINSPYNEIDY